MCIVCVKPANVELDDEVINTMWKNNSDGAGFMFAENNTLHIEKGLMTLADFKTAYEPHKFKKLVLHFRIKTHGETNQENTHPFRIDDNLAFVHNGVITGFGSNTHSDTWHFNEEIIKPLREQLPSFLNCKPIQRLILEKIGYSKLVFMNNQGDVTIVNQQLGDESSDGFWFSNSTWKSLRNYNHLEPYQFQKKSRQENNSGNGKNDNKESSSHQQTNTTTTTSKYNRDIFQLNDLVYLSKPFKGIDVGTLGIVSWFTSGYSVAVSFKDGTHYIPCIFLEKAIPIKLTKRIGHLTSENNLIFIDENDKGNLTRVCETTSGKYYWIPTDSWITVPKDDINYLDYLPVDVLTEASSYSGM